MPLDAAIGTGPDPTPKRQDAAAGIVRVFPDASAGWRRDHQSITETPNSSRPLHGTLAAGEAGGRPGPVAPQNPVTPQDPVAPQAAGPGAPPPPPQWCDARGWPSPAARRGTQDAGFMWDRSLERRPGRLHGRGPWRRSRDDRLFAGVAGGIARRFGIDSTLVRIAFVIATLAGGWGLTLYIAAWLLMPLDGRDESVGVRVVRDRQGILLALAFVPALIVAMAVGSALHASFLTSLAWPMFLCCAGGVLLWRNSDPDERAWLRQAVEPVVHIGSRSSRSWARLGLRVALGAILVFIGVVLLALRHNHSSDTIRPVEGALAVAAAVVVLFGPWWLRLIRELVAERQARQRAEDRADMAARVHDSVLQSLALIQRAADDPQRVVQLARSQERELRAWLFDGDIPGAVGDKAATLTTGAALIASEVEERHGVPVEVVTVGDCPLDERLRALLDAAREATVNAAKWSGASTISLFAEVEPAKVSMFVRDRGHGFDPDAVAHDRHGIAESIEARMLRHGGRADVRTAPGDGTEVELVMPRAPGR